MTYSSVAIDALRKELDSLRRAATETGRTFGRLTEMKASLTAEISQIERDIRLLGEAINTSLTRTGKEAIEREIRCLETVKRSSTERLEGCLVDEQSLQSTMTRQAEMIDEILTDLNRMVVRG